MSTEELRDLFSYDPDTLSNTYDTLCGTRASMRASAEQGAAGGAVPGSGRDDEQEEGARDSGQGEHAGCSRAQVGCVRALIKGSRHHTAFTRAEMGARSK